MKVTSSGGGGGGGGHTLIWPKRVCAVEQSMVFGTSVEAQTGH